MREKTRASAVFDSGEYSVSLRPRQAALVACGGLLAATLLFASGVVVGRWYGAAAQVSTPTLAALDEAAAQAPAARPALSFHEELSKPSPSSLPAVLALDETPAEEAPKPSKKAKPADEGAPVLDDQDEGPKPPAKKAKPGDATASKPGDKTPAKADPKAKKEKAKPVETYAVKAGVYSSKAAVDSLAKTLKARGEPVSVVKNDSGKYVLLVGTFPSEAEAKKAQAAIKHKHKLPSTTITTF